MNEYIAGLVQLVKRDVTKLKGNFYPVLVDEGVKTPYAIYDNMEETPIRTIHGIVGYRCSIDINIFDGSLSNVNAIKNDMIKALDNRVLAGKKMRLQQATYIYYEQVDFHSYKLNFNLK